jgi:predicted transcriptional regulator
MTLEDDDKLLHDIDDHKVEEAAKWGEKLKEKYDNLHNVISENLPNLWSALEFALSVKTILNIKDCTLPFAGIILGPPSSLKTVVIELFKGTENTYHTHDFSPHSWVSHNAAIKKEKLKDVDMLPMTKNKFFLTPELAPMFSSREEDLVQQIGILTSVLDGHGFTSNTGAQGKRGYDEDIMFTWLGAAVDIPYKVHKTLSTLGPKLYFFRLPKKEEDEESYYEHKDEDFDKKKREIKTALIEYLEYFDTNPTISFEPTNELPKIPLTHSKDEEFAHRYIIRLGKLLAPLRAVVPTWETKDSQGSEYNFDIAIVEDPSRAITQLRNLARGHALSQGRDYITVDDIPVLIHMVFSTCSLARATIFELLIENNGTLITSQIVEYLNTSKPTALRTMTELKATGLVNMKEEAGGYHGLESKITLKDKFSWFLEDTFDQLRERKEKCTPRTDPSSTIINNQIKYGENVNDNEPLRGGQNSLRSNPQPEDVIEENNSKKHTLYWSANMGKWGCNDCNQKGDKFDMQGVCKCK